MVTIFMMMTPGKGIRNAQLLPSLVQDWSLEGPLLKPKLLLFNIKTGLLNWRPQQHPHKTRRLFPSMVTWPKWNGYHAQLILFICLPLIHIQVKPWKMMVLSKTLKFVKQKTRSQKSSGMIVMKTLIALYVHKVKNILARDLQQSNQRENSSTSLKVDKKVYHIGQCSKSK